MRETRGKSGGRPREHGARRRQMEQETNRLRNRRR
jgi:hypothetical protein